MKRIPLHQLDPGLATDGQAIVYSETAGKFVPGDVAAGGGIIDPNTPGTPGSKYLYTLTLDMISSSDGVLTNPALAINGTILGNEQDMASFGTTNQTKQWFQVDLGKYVMVASVEVYMTPNDGTWTIYNQEIQVSKDGTTWTSIWSAGSQAVSGAATTGEKSVPGAGTWWRYVRYGCTHNNWNNARYVREIYVRAYQDMTNEILLNDLYDVDLTGAVAGKILGTVDGTTWTPIDPPAGSGSGGGSSGGGTVSHAHTYVTSGAVSVATSSAFVDASPVQDLVVTAATGDVVLLTLDARVTSGGWFVLDYQTIVNSAVVNSVTASGTPDINKAHAGWTMGSAVTDYVVSATRSYVVKSGDVAANGTVTFRLRGRGGGTTTLRGDGSPGAYFAATVYGGGAGNPQPGTGTYVSTVLAHANLVNFWRLNETTGTTFADSKGTAPGTAVSSAHVFPGIGPKFDGSPSVMLNGQANARITMAATVPAQFTLEIWCNWATFLQNTGLLGKWGTNGAMLYTNENGVQLHMQGTGVAFWKPGSRYWCDQLWHHIVGTFDGTTAKLYIDGALKMSGAITGFTSASATFEIGSYNNGTAAELDAAVAAAAVYNAAITATEVLDHYQRGVG